MTRQELFQQITAKNSYLCIGLDTDIKKIPSHLLKEKDPVFEFNRQIIDATHKYCVAYKPNLAFYESQGVKGWESLLRTIEYIPKEIFTIADAKRGDIGNTSSLYARAFFDKQSSGFDFDSITIAPYMGEDSVKPFLEFEGKWAILLALTSNVGSRDFQMQTCDGTELYMQVLQTSKLWGNSSNMMYVVGATHPDLFEKVRSVVPDHFLLVPGVGAQGGDLHGLSKVGMNKECGLLVNASRSIIYASTDANFSKDAAKEALAIQQEMKIYLDKYL
ncbi:MAG TPA: orotidine-5'-phosphate decarboxylase [Cytophagaceae bacterium]|jgi:orotidine-5'-phosphate decarboxylase